MKEIIDYIEKRTKQIDKDRENLKTNYPNLFPIENNQQKSKTNMQKIKAKLLNILLQSLDIYEDTNKYLYKAWLFAISRQTNNRITIAITKLLENTATTLFLNTLLFAFVGTIFGGLIERILFTLCFLNILLFCANILNWKDKLKK